LMSASVTWSYVLNLMTIGYGV